MRKPSENTIVANTKGRFIDPTSEEGSEIMQDFEVSTAKSVTTESSNSCVTNREDE